MPYSGTPEEKAAKRRAYYQSNRERLAAMMKAYNARPEVREATRKRRLIPGPARERLLAKKREDSKLLRLENPAHRKAYFDARKHLKAEYDRAYRARNREKIDAKVKAWLRENKERYNASLRAKRRADPQFAIANNMRCRINIALRTVGLKRNKPLQEILGCTIEQLMAHLEAQFQPGMTWENRGKWHVDHKRPCAAFDLTDPAQRAACFHFTNLQPLWAADNIRKSDKLVA